MASGGFHGAGSVWLSSFGVASCFFVQIPETEAVGPAWICKASHTEERLRQSLEEPPLPSMPLVQWAEATAGGGGVWIVPV